MTSPKQAAPDHPIHDLIAQRWSPYAYSDRAVSDEDLRSLFEAARWAASSYNEQPWSYIVATRDDAEQFAKVLSCLVEPNQAWAQAAPVLVLCCTNLNFSRNGKPNAAASHDLGLAAGNLCLEATQRGLCVHQMIGILPENAQEIFAIPAGTQPLTAMAIGYPVAAENLPDALKDRDTAPRERKPLADFVFEGKWGDRANLTSRSDA